MTPTEHNIKVHPCGCLQLKSFGRNGSRMIIYCPRESPDMQRRVAEVKGVPHDHLD